MLPCHFMLNCQEIYEISYRHVNQLLTFGSSMFTMGVDKNGEYAVKVKGVDMSPDPVVRGKPATFRISASTGKFRFFFCFVLRLFFHI